MAIKEPGHGLIMIRRVRAHDRGLCVCLCVLYVHKYKFVRCWCGICAEVQVMYLRVQCRCIHANVCLRAAVLQKVMCEGSSAVRARSIWTMANAMYFASVHHHRRSGNQDATEL